VIRLFVFFVPISYLGSLLYQIEGMFWGGVLANLMMASVSFVWFKRSINEQVDSISAKQQEA
jgi:Na+-driven multidrug efflux pump